MNVKYPDVIPALKPVIPTSSSDKPKITQTDKPVGDNKDTKSEAKTDVKTDAKDKKPEAKNKPFLPPVVLLSDRNQILSNGTYIQARREAQDALKPIIDNLTMLYAEKKDDSSKIPSFKALIDKNVPDSKKFSELLTDTIDTIKKGNFTFKQLQNLNTVFDTLDAFEKNTATSDELTNFKTHYKDIKAGWDTVFNTKDNRLKFVFHVLNGIDLNDDLDKSIKNLSQSPLNQNADLALFTEQMTTAAKIIRDITGNVSAYSQANYFEESGLHKRALEMPDAFREFTFVLSDIASNPLVQNNKDYIDLLSNVHANATKVMDFILPEVKKAIDTQNPPVVQPAAPASSPVVEKKAEPSKDKLPDQQAFLNALGMHPTQQTPQIPQALLATSNPQGNSGGATDMSPQMQQMIEYLNQKNRNPKNLVSPYAGKNHVHSPTSDDKELRSLQGLWDWADHASHMKNKINAVNDIGQTMEEIAMSGSGRPNPEMVALSKRAKRLDGLKGLMAEVPKINKATHELEKAALESQHAYMTGVNQIATQKLKLDIDGAHMQSEQQKVYQKGLEKLGLDALEIATGLSRANTKTVGLFNEILMARIDIVWANIKRMTQGFKF